VFFRDFVAISAGLETFGKQLQNSVGSKLWAWKQEIGVRGTELWVARGSVGAEAPPPPRAQPKFQFGL